MWKDDIVEQVREKRQEYARQFDFKVDKIYHDLKKQEVESGRSTVSLPPKRIKPPSRKSKARVAAQPQVNRLFRPDAWARALADEGLFWEQAEWPDTNLTLELNPSILPNQSWVKISQVRTLSTERIGEVVGKISPEEVERKWNG